MTYTTIIMFVILIGAVYWMQRSQKKQAQERQNQLNAIVKGDEVVTIGGMYALVDEVDNDNKKIVLDVDGVFLPFELTAIKRVVSKGNQATEATPVEGEEETKENTEVVETDKTQPAETEAKAESEPESPIEK